MVVTKQQKQEIRANLAETPANNWVSIWLAPSWRLELSLHILQSVMPRRQGRPHTSLEMLKKANEEVNRLIVILDAGKLR